MKLITLFKDVLRLASGCVLDPADNVESGGGRRGAGDER